ncbi:MAG: urease subunit gamma [Phycisphaerae bacterium]
MHLMPREIEKLMLHNAGFLAQKRLARGVRLNYPEAVALIATQLLEFIRDGKTVSELMTLGQKLLGRNQVMAGVAEMIEEVQVEGTFPDGTKLVTVHHPVAMEEGDLELALYGSFLPVPGGETQKARHNTQKLVLASGGGEGGVVPGETMTLPGEIEANGRRKFLQLGVTNVGDRPVQVGSHYHFIETNGSLVFDRSLAYGMRLDIPAGTAVRFEPGETKTVQLVEIAGEQVIHGGNNLADGRVTAPNHHAAMGRVVRQGFGHVRAEGGNDE